MIFNMPLGIWDMIDIVGKYLFLWNMYLFYIAFGKEPLMDLLVFKPTYLAEAIY